MMNDRISKLKDIIINSQNEICIERGLAITKSYMQTEGEPIIIRRGKALKCILEEMSIYIDHGELIVGNQAFHPKAAPIFPEFGMKWLVQELDSFHNRRLDPFFIAEEKKNIIRKMNEYWREKNHQTMCLEKIQQSLPKEIKDHYNLNNCSINQVLGNLYHTTTGDGHIIADYNKLLTIGVKGIRRIAIKALEHEINENKINFLNSVIIVLDASVKFAHRFADLAEEKAKRESDEHQQKELIEISKICRNVPENPPQNFHEALQTLWFAQLIIQIESNGQSISFGRFDQLLYPFYKRDVGKNLMTREKALELIECLFLKSISMNKIRDWGSTEFNTGYPMYQTLTLGGQDINGNDNSNELSYLVLEATADLKENEPTTVVRIHKNTTEKFFMAAINTLARHGGGLPGFFNDEIAIPLLKHLPHNHIPLEQARNWAIMGCVEPTIPGKCLPSTGGTCVINLAKLLEITLHGGLNPATGEKVYLQKKVRFDYWSDFWSAYIEQLRFYMSIIPCLMKSTCNTYREWTPTPYLSSLISNRIELASDVFEGKGDMDHDIQLIELHGLATATDSLFALKKYVFDEKRFSMEEMKNMLRANFKGYERERLLFKNKAFKYGNAKNSVDKIAYNILEVANRIISQYQSPRGGCYGISTQTTTCNVPDGYVVGATPDGRKAGKPLSDNNSPATGMDKNGPTFAMKSVASIGHKNAAMGTLYNMRFSPQQFETENGKMKFAQLIKGYFEDGGYQVQFNVISNKILREAQKHPEMYRNLIVKVAGYSARFTNLDRQLQDQLISRTVFGGKA